MIRRYAIFLFILTITVAVAAASGITLHVPVAKKFFSDRRINVGSDTIPVRAVIAPHHLLAEQKIDELFREVSSQDGDRVKHVVIVSPDHFENGAEWVTVSSRPLPYPDGTIPADNVLTDRLASFQRAAVNDTSFRFEHGVSVLTPFVAKYFSDATLTAVMIKDGMPADLVTAFSETLSALPENTLIVLSMDISHELSPTAAGFHDARTLDVIQSQDIAHVSSLDIDNPSGLGALLGFVRHIGHGSVTVTAHTDSETFVSTDTTGETTSHILAYFHEGLPERDAIRTVQLLFVGDIMLDRDIRTKSESYDPTWHTEIIRRLLWSQDANVGNLEGVIRDTASVSAGTTPDDPRNYLLSFDPSQTERFLRFNRFLSVSLANNHSDDFGSAGFGETTKHLRDFGVSFFGRGELREDCFQTNEWNGVKVAFVGYNQFGSDCHENVTDIVKQLSNEYFVIVMPHWGVEYELSPTETQRILAREWIDAGADTVIGAHPHVVQDIELYQDKAIFYSLGNFVFDQYFSDDVRTRLAVGIRIENGVTRYFLIPLSLRQDSRLELMDRNDRETLLGRILPNGVPENIFDQF